MFLLCWSPLFLHLLQSMCMEMFKPAILEGFFSFNIHIQIYRNLIIFLLHSISHKPAVDQKLHLPFLPESIHLGSYGALVGQKSTSLSTGSWVSSIGKGPPFFWKGKERKCQIFTKYQQYIKRQHLIYYSTRPLIFLLVTKLLVSFSPGYNIFIFHL